MSVFRKSHNLAQGVLLNRNKPWAILKIQIKRISVFCLLASLFVAAPCCPQPPDESEVDREVVRQLGCDIGKSDCDMYLVPLKFGESDVPAIFKELESKDPDACVRAAHKLAYLGKNHSLGNMEKDVIAAFKNLLESEHKTVRHAAAIGVVALDPSFKDDLTKRIYPGSHGRHLVCIDPSLKDELMPVIVEIIRDGTDEGHVSLAAIICARMGIKEAVPALIELINKQKPEFIPRRSYFYYRVLQGIGTPEALEFSKWPLWRESIFISRRATPLDDYLVDRTWPDFLFLSGFVYLFWRSRRARKSGIKISYRPLLITVFVWSLQTVEALNCTNIIDFPDLIVMFINLFGSLTRLSPYSLPLGLIVGTLFGLVPWIVSFMRLKESEKRILFKGIIERKGKQDSNI